MADTPDALIPVTVVVCLAPRSVRELELQLPAGATVADALRASGVDVVIDAAQTPGAAEPALSCGIWGRKVALTQRLVPLDRVEVYRPLQVDPKHARRERFARQGKRGSGLFAKRTANLAKDGSNGA